MNVNNITSTTARPEPTFPFAYDRLDVIGNLRESFFEPMDDGVTERSGKTGGYNYADLIVHVPVGENPTAVALDAWGRVWWSNSNTYWLSGEAWYRSPSGRLMPGCHK